MFIATLIAMDRLTRGDISAAADALGGARGHEWIEDGSACDLWLDDATDARAMLEHALPGIDVVIQPRDERRKLLLVADMDSTMITVECIDELADYAGLKAEVAAVTERAMRGELDFEAALDARVALLKGLDSRVIEQCLEERVRLTPGAVALVRTMKANGAHTILVSGGFTAFAGPVGTEIGFDLIIACRLAIAGGVLTGKVKKPIVDSAFKLGVLRSEAQEYRIPIEAVLAVGDGANDIPMIQAAGLGIAYHAKPVTAAAADARIEANDLTALLYAQGYARKDWVEA